MGANLSTENSQERLFVPKTPAGSCIMYVAESGPSEYLADVPGRHYHQRHKSLNF